MGEEDFCSDAKHFPECDPQLPPTITFYKGKTYLGKEHSNTWIKDSYDKLGIFKSVDCLISYSKCNYLIGVISSKTILDYQCDIS